MTLRLSEKLAREGVCVARGAAGPELCARAQAEALVACEAFAALPMSMAERRRGNTHRVFLPFSVKRGGEQRERSPTSRYEFRLPMSRTTRSMLEAVLSGDVGGAIAENIGEDCELSGLVYIVSEKGAVAQAVHSDGNWGENAPKVITLFLATSDIQDEDMGPTRFMPATHAPECFDGGEWLPPTPANGVREREDVWFPLNAGDAVMMQSTLWHCGGANTSEKKRVLLSFSFTQRNNTSSSSAADADSWTLRDFRQAARK